VRRQRDVKQFLLDRRGDADNLQLWMQGRGRLARLVHDADHLPERILVGKQPAGEGFVDDRDTRSSGIFFLGSCELAAAHHAKSERTEIVRTDHPIRPRA
jgi:hypothetical protein